MSWPRRNICSEKRIHICGAPCTTRFCPSYIHHVYKPRLTKRYCCIVDSRSDAHVLCLKQNLYFVPKCYNAVNENFFQRPGAFTYLSPPWVMGNVIGVQNLVWAAASMPMYTNSCGLPSAFFAVRASVSILVITPRSAVMSCVKKI